MEQLLRIVVVISVFSLCQAGDGLPNPNPAPTKRDHATGSLMCNETSMMLTFNKTVLESRERNYTIKFADNDEYPCKIEGDTIETNTIDDQVWIMAHYNQCGIHVFDHSNHSIGYNQTVIVTYGENPDSDLVFREEYDEYNVQCVKKSNYEVELEEDYLNVTHEETEEFKEVGNATFDIDLDRYTDDNFSSKDESGEAELGDTLYFQMELETSRTDLKLNTLSCHATKESDGSKKYSIIAEKCPKDKTVKVYKGENTKKIYRWHIEAFKFFGDSDKVYIQCNVVVCLDDSDHETCKPCGSRKRRALKSLSGKVTTNGDDIPVTVRSGLIVFIDGTKVQSNSGKSEAVFAGTKGTIVIVLLAVIVFIFVIVVIKKFFFTRTVQVPAVSMKAVEACYDNKAME